MKKSTLDQLHFKYNILITSLFATLAVWTIFGAVPHFALLGPFLRLIHKLYI